MASKNKHRVAKAPSISAAPVSEASLVREEEHQKREDLFKHGSKYLAARRSDIVGIDGILEEADQIIDWIKNIKFYRKQDARLEPGIIFYGAPGTGKTLTARYIATETDALFIDVRDWPYRGALPVASDISALFQLARDTYAKHK